ncbi:MAG: RluA family pseudouridine synthase [Caldilineaceae bacterium]|nr:RluA family pseudouridine synthase [Caldilineaceae bacterium]
MDNESQDVHQFTVPPSAAGQRLDRWLTDQFEEESRSAIQRWIAEGLVTVDGGRAGKAGLPLEAEAEIEVAAPPIPVESSLRPENIPLDIIFENDNLLVINKPAGLVVHPGPGHTAGTLANAVLHHCPQLEGIGGEKRPGIVHRLDKGTSGVIVVAKNDTTMRSLQEQFAGRTVYKEYLALLEGRVEPPRGRIDAPIGRHPTRRQRMAVLPARAGLEDTSQPTASGREAVTEYECLQVYEDQTSGQTARFSLVRAVLLTGRTHQVRVHFGWRKHPVAGDTEYGYKRRRLSLTRPFLHAHKLGIRLPGEAEQRVFESPLPAELQRILDRLGE